MTPEILARLKASIAGKAREIVHTSAAHRHCAMCENMAADIVAAVGSLEEPSAALAAIGIGSGGLTAPMVYHEARHIHELIEAIEEQARKVAQQEAAKTA